MSILRTCDYCGKEIECGQPFVTFEVDGKHSDDRWSSGYVGHYHSSEETPLERVKRGPRTQAPTGPDCWKVVDEALELVHATGPSLEAIPTAQPSRRAIPAPVPVPVKGKLDLELAGDVAPVVAAALRRHGVRTLEEAAERSRLDLLMLESVGAATVDKLEAALAEQGLELRPGPTAEDLGERITAERKRRGLSAGDIARAMYERAKLLEREGDFKVHSGVVRAWEKGRRIPTREQLAELAVVLELPAERLAGTPVSS